MVIKGTLRTIKETLENNIPVIIIAVKLQLNIQIIIANLYN